MGKVRFGDLIKDNSDSGEGVTFGSLIKKKENTDQESKGIAPSGEGFSQPAKTVTQPISNHGENNVLAPVETPSTNAFLDYKSQKDGMSLLAPEKKPTTIHEDIKSAGLSVLNNMDSGQDRVSNFMGHVDQTIANLPADLLQGGAVLMHPIDKGINSLLGKASTPINESALYKMGESYKNATKEIFPTNPAFQEDLDSKVGDALGNLTSLAMSGGVSAEAKALAEFTKASNMFVGGAKIAGKTLATPPSLIGATQMGVSEFNAAKQAGADDDTAFNSFLKNAAAGSVLEALPIQKFWKRLDTTTGGGVRNLLKNGTIQGFEEGTTEIAQQIFSNVSAEQSYDTTRKWYDGMMESGGIGFGLGFLLGGMGTSLRKKQSEAKTPEEKASIQKAIDFVDQKSEELKPKTEDATTTVGTEPVVQHQGDNGQLQNEGNNRIEPSEEQKSSPETSNSDQLQRGKEELTSKRSEILANLPIDKESGQPIVDEKAKLELADIHNQITSLENEEVKTTEEAISQEKPKVAAVQEGQKLEEESLEPNKLNEGGVTNLQWMANKEGGQIYGNKQTIQPLTKELYEKYGISKMNGGKTFEENDKLFPNEYISLVDRNDGKLIVDKVDSLDELQKTYDRQIKTGWVKKVNDFNDKSATQHGGTFDSEVNSNGETNPTADTGTQPEAIVPEQKIPHSEGNSVEADKGVIPPVTPIDEILPSGSDPNKKERQAYTKAKEDEKLSDELKHGVDEKGRLYDPETHAKWDAEAESVLKDGLEHAEGVALDPQSDISDQGRVKLIKQISNRYDKLATEAKKAEDFVLEKKNRDKAIQFLKIRTVAGTNPGKTIAAYHDINGNVSPTERLYNAKKHIADQTTEALKPHDEHIANITNILNSANEDAIKEVLNHPKIVELIGKKSGKVVSEAKKKTVKDVLDYLESKKISLKDTTNDITFALPATVYNGAIDAIKLGIKAGHSISKAVNAGIAYIKKNHKGEWDKDGFAKQFDVDLKKYEVHLDPEKAITGALKDQETNIREIVKKHYTKVDKAKESIVNKLVSEAGLDEASAKELTKEIAESFDKLSTKAKQDAIKKAKSTRKAGAPKVKQSIDEKLIELSNTGVLSDEQARQVYAEKLGIKDITEQESARIIELGETIQEADDVAEETQSDFTEKNIKNHTALQVEKQKAINEIADILESKKPKNVWDTLGTIMQGNLLSPISIITNVYSNAILQGLRFASKALVQPVDMAYSKITGKPRVIDIYASSIGYKTGFKNGVIEGGRQLKTGADIQELQKLEVSRGFKPIRALLTGLSIKQSQSKAERVNNLIEGTFGMPAEVFFRMLNLGDKPFQRAAELAKAHEVASLKGLNEEAKNKFLLFPDKESAETIKKAGEDATFKSHSVLSEGASKAISWVQQKVGETPIIGGPMKLLVKSQFPFVKTPVNIMVETVNFAVPPVSMTMSIYYGLKGDRTKCLELMGKAAIGIMLKSAADLLLENELLTGSPEEDKKERSLQYQAAPPEGINISGLARLLNGDDPKIKKNDTWITYSKMGVPAVVFKMRAKADKNKKEGNTKFDNQFDELLYDTFSSIPSAAASGVELSFLQGTNTLLTAIKDGKYDDWMVNTFNAVSSIALPNTLASLNRVARQNLPELRDDALSKRLLNVLKVKTFTSGDLPSKIDLWGQPIKQTPEGRNALMYHLFDVTKAREISADQTSYNVFKLWQETGDNDAIPAIPSRTQTYNSEGESVKAKLTPKQFERLQKYVGTARKSLVDSYLSDTNDNNEDKIVTLKDLYEEGLYAGKEQFFNEAIEFNDKINILMK